MKSRNHDLGLLLAEEENWEDALIFLNRAYKIDNDISALNDIAVVHNRTNNYEEAMKYYKLASDNGLGIASCNLGRMYQYGHGTRIDYDKAVELFNKSIEQGYSHAYFKLAEMYLYGYGVQKDDRHAIELLLKGYEKHDAACASELSYRYQKGIGCEVDIKKAYKFAQFAAKKNDTTGIYNVAHSLQFGKGTRKNINKAIDMYMICAQRGYADASYQLFEIYFNGYDVEQDRAQALYWLERCLNDKSLKGYIRYTEMRLNHEINDNLDDIEHATMAVAMFNSEVNESYEEELEKYEILKKEFPNALDWELIESDPTGCLNKVSQTIN